MILFARERSDREGEARGEPQPTNLRDHASVAGAPSQSAPPGEEHWHGALPDHFMTHLAMWGDDDATWGDLVTDEEYAAATRR